MPVRATYTNEPLLRSPPFPGIDAAVSRPLPLANDSLTDSGEIDRLFATIRDARVGGLFWGPPAPNAHAIVVRAKSAAETESIRATLDSSDRDAVLWLPATSDVNPWSLLDMKTRLIAHGDDEWVALAHIAGCPVEILSEGRFGAPGATAVDLRSNASRALSSARYRNPFTGREDSIDAAIAQLAGWRDMFEANSNIVAACGMAWWKRREIASFLWAPAHPLRFFRSESRAVAHAARAGGAIAVWPSRITAELSEKARQGGVPLVRVEDGFVRSVGLGSNLVPPSSITVDRLGIHYDPTRPSDLERLLAETRFPHPLLARAKALREAILDAGISKYGGNDDHAFPLRQPDRRLILVPGQVEDDMSVRLGGGGLVRNLELLSRVRAIEPDAEIWFRPHPDVDAGHRKGTVPDGDVLRHADRIVRGGSMARLLGKVDAVHVLTSLTGFEALMRGLDVTCHGTPFYAGWGLTRDMALVPERRGRSLTLDQLTAGVLIVYPRYLDPLSGLPCPPEILIQRMTEGSAHNRLSWVSRIRQVQGQLTKLLPWT